MSATATIPGRSIRRVLCEKGHGEYGQEYLPGIPNVREGVWVGSCRECQADIRRERQIAEENETETDRRIADDPQFEERVQSAAQAAMMEKMREELEGFCADWQPVLEEQCRNVERNRILAVVTSEKVKG